MAAALIFKVKSSMLYAPCPLGRYFPQPHKLSLLLASLLLWSCSPAPSLPSQAQQHLQVIARQHFQEMPIAKDLLPIADFDRWAGTRMQVKHDDQGHVFTIPPPPPEDTILYDSDFRTIARQAGLTRGDTRALRSELQSPDHLQLLLPQTGLRLLPQATSPAAPHYCLSAPLFNTDYTIVLLTVHHCVSGDFRGYRYLLERDGTDWEVRYARLYLIE